MTARPRQPQDRKRSAKDVLEDGKPFDWTVGDVTVTLPPAKDIPGGGWLIIRAAKGEIGDADVLQELLDLLGDEVPELEGMLKTSTISEIDDLMESWLRVSERGE